MSYPPPQTGKPGFPPPLPGYRTVPPTRSPRSRVLPWLIGVLVVLTVGLLAVAGILARLCLRGGTTPAKPAAAPAHPAAVKRSVTETSRLIDIQ